MNSKSEHRRLTRKVISEMTCRHAQWLIVIKRTAKTDRAKAQAAATRHQPRPPAPIDPNQPRVRTKNPSTGASETPCSRCLTRQNQTLVITRYYPLLCQRCILK